ncbi:MAG: cob(I)yrinic acid a,c-diamide adenosyltransferase [Bacteriovoracia bacterium]
MKIYTKTGDKGDTGLVGGQRVPKNDPKIELYGTIDELNSVLGLVRSALNAIESEQMLETLNILSVDLEKIQHWLFDLGSLLASLPKDRDKYKLKPITPAEIIFLEEKIDGATQILKPLKEFILPGGSEPAARIHLARTIARRAERLCIAVKEDLPENGLVFLNRLSDYLFVMARLCNHHLGISDTTWKK